MKKISIRLMGVVLTLALLAGLIMAAVPVSAGTMAWTNLKMPALTENTDATVYAISGDGKVIYLYDGTNFCTSTDGGTTWDKDLEVPGTGPTMIAVHPTNSDYLVATDGTDLYRSTNGGDSWKTLTLPGTLAGINDIAVAEGEDDAAIAVAADNGVAIYDDAEGEWHSTDAAATDLDIAGGWDTVGAYAVAFSPNFKDDATLVAVAFNGTPAIFVKTLIVYFDQDSFWDDEGDAAVEITDASAATDAMLVLPSDYDVASQKIVFVVADDEAYRVDAESFVSLGAPTGISSMDYKGTADEGTMAIGLGDEVRTSTNADTSDDPDWVKSTKNPMGDGAVVKFSAEDLLYVGTSGTGSALYVATADDDYASFDGIAFISVGDLDLVSFNKSLKGAGTNNMYRVINDLTAGSEQYMIFNSTDSGKTWKMIKNNADPISDIYVSRTYADDKTIYIFQQDAGLTYYKYLKTTNGGKSWSSLNLVDRTPAKAFALIDANTYWIGSSEGIQKSTWADPVEIADGETVDQIFDFGAFQVVRTTNGSVAASTDGTTFETLGEGGDFSPAPGLTFDVPNKIIYAQAGTGDFMSWTVGTSEVWKTEATFTDLPDTLEAVGVSSLMLASDGLFYITSRGNEDGQVWRSVDLKAENFEAIPGSDFDTDGTDNVIDRGPQSVYKDAAGNSVLVQAVKQPVGDADNENDYPWAMFVFTQTVAAAPEIVSPAANAAVPGNVDFKWNKVVYSGTVNYDLQIAYDADFNNIVGNNDYEAISGTMKSVSGLPAGKSMYWRVRVAPESPLASKWSAAVPFTTKVVSANLDDGISAAGRISPVSGATGVSTMPAITWGAVNGATGYNFALASDAGFTQIVETKDGLTGTVYSPAKPLEAGKVYFWRVQAANGTNVGDWVTSAFTTAAAAVAAPTATAPAPPISIPTPIVTVAPPAVTVNPAPPATPAYIWVIIVIGAVLVIAVIVLIARTRRV